MRMIFIGGPGRSGTSLLARRLGQHPDVCSFPDVELKLLTEKDGLLDLHHTLVQAFSPNRAAVAVAQFERLTEALITGRFGQAAFAEFATEATWRALFQKFCSSLVEAGQPVLTESVKFTEAARDVLEDISQIAMSLSEPSFGATVFLEKTPHALLAMEFLDQIAPGSRFVHVMRDPRAIAYSLHGMSWGPGDLGACCEWVHSYTQAWLLKRAYARSKGLPMIELRIEEVIGAKEIWTQTICDQLGLAQMPDLLEGAHLSTLNKWRQNCGSGEYDLLNTKLRDVAEAFGYDAAQSGLLRATLSELA